MLLVKTTLRPSPVHGIGLFADEFISRGTIVWKFHPGFDARYDPTEIDALPAPAREQMLRYGYINLITGKLVLCMDDARFFNHADQPNTLGCEGDDEEGYTIAGCDIVRGEELLCDYLSYDADGARKLGR